MPLFGKTLQGPFDLTINHWDPAHLEITRQGREATRLAVAWTMWEMDGMSHCENLEDRKDENGREHDGLAKRLRWFDAVLGYSDVTMRSLDPYIPEGVHRGVLQGGFEASEWKPWSAIGPVIASRLACMGR